MRIALGVEYDGSRYYGWQRQDAVPSVQAALESALTKIANEPISVVCAGRTDAGVHATGQVVHFDTGNSRAIQAWSMGVNSNLPKDIAVRWAAEVPTEFHARFSATARRYRYVICNQKLRPGILQAGVTHVYTPIDATRMHRAAQCLLGENDFTSFRAAHCQSNTPYRNVHEISVRRFGEYVIVEVQANAFVHHMVRNIVGSLLEIGKGEQAEQWLADVLAARDRTQAAATAKPDGLYLVEVIYPESTGLPKMPRGPLWFPDTLNDEGVGK